jgi:cytochrome b561
MTYDRGAIAFHWIIALMIGGLALLGFNLESFPKETQLYWINIHVTVGLVYFLMVAGRLGWRLTHRPPDLPEGVGPLTRKASVATHHLLYLLMLAVPVVGFVALVWHGRGFDYGLFKINFGVPSNRNVFHAAEEVHENLVILLLAVSALHALAAFWHQYIRRDGVLGRMVPWLAH